jgi:hypothetical protein
MAKTTSAQRMRKLREKLKEDKLKYENHKEKERERDRRRRESVKLKVSSSKKSLIDHRRKEAERKRQYRLKLKSALVEQRELELCTPLGSYKCPQSLGKAVSRVKKVLPFSPSKKTAVIRKLVCESFQKKVSNAIFPEDKKTSYNKLSNEALEKIKRFFMSDDISRQAPGIKDFKSVKDKATGKRINLQKRHMNMTVKEAFALFKEENSDVNVKSSKFYELRPENVLLSNEMPHNVCVCKYHANFIFVIDAIHQKIDSFPSSHADILSAVCCNLKSEKCMSSECEKCLTNLHSLIEEDFDVSKTISWKKWTEDECRPKLTVVDGTINEAVADLQSQLRKFKEHFFVKRQQAEAFKTLKESVIEGEVILQIDFAENYLSLTQDEIQSAHWSHKQITVVTACAWSVNGLQSYAIVSDELCHDKYSVYACLKMLISKIKNELPNLNSVRIFSDGCSGQFKNKFTLSNLCHMQQDFDVTGEWFFFATSHGKGAVDGIGGLAKRAVWNQVKARKVIVQNAEQFLECAKSAIPSINFFLLTNHHIDENRGLLEKRWKSVKKIKEIRSKHYFNGYNTTSIVCGRTFFKSTLGLVQVFEPKPSVYASIYGTDSEMSDDSPNPDDTLIQVKGSEPIANKITPGTYMLVKFQTARKKSMSYRYVAIAQSSVDEEDGEIKVMCLKSVCDSAKKFKADEKDVSYIEFKQVLSILPEPDIKYIRNTIFYEFPGNVDIFESG